MSNLISVKREGAIVKKTRRTMSAVVSGKDISEPDVEAEMVQHQVEQCPSKTSTRKIFLLRLSKLRGKENGKERM